MLNNNGQDKRGAKRRTPDSALTALLYENDVSSYYLQQNGILNSGQIYNAKKRDVNRYSIKFLKTLGTAMNMKWTTVGVELLNLQKQYPPKIVKDHRKQNTYLYKKKA